LSVTSALSHAAVRLLGIKAKAGFYRVFGSEFGKPVAALYGSSPAFDGLDWNQVGQSLCGGLANWGIPGSSPTEWEMMQLRAPDAVRTFIVVSPYDLNDYFLCDFRAEIVPMGKTLAQLREAGVDLPFSRKILSQYPLALVRRLFPTAGRSGGVMVGVRHWLTKWTGRSDSRTRIEDRVPLFGSTGPNMIRDKLTDWDTARLQRRIEMTREGCQGKQWFDGLKKRALIRMVRLAAAHGKVTLVVMPMSPIYEQAFLTPQAVRDLDQALADVQAAGANTPIIRLDHLPALHNNDVFWDMVHLNMDGQKIATAALLEEIRTH
jgi:hypothetical protein